MKKNLMRILAIGAALLLAAAVAHPVLASCGNPREVTTFDSNTGALSYVYTPGACVYGGGLPCGQGYFAYPGTYYSSVTGHLVGSFWGIGVGNPALNAGADNGSFGVGTNAYGLYPNMINPYVGWVNTIGGTLFYPARIQGDWQAAGVDGCIDAAIPVGTKCNAVLLSDTRNDEGYFVFLTALANANANYVYTRPGGAPINLVKVPKVAITGSTRLNTGSVSVTVDPPFGASPGTSEGFYLDAGCAGVGSPTGWKVVSRQVVGHGGPPPTDRDVSNWSAPLNTGQAFDGTGDTVTVNCSQDVDVYLAYTIEFDSGFELTFVGDNSTRVECGENLAEPGERPTQLQIQSDQFRRKPASGRRGN